MNQASNHQAQYWDAVALRISESKAPGSDLVGYHSPYDVHVRAVALELLGEFSARVQDKRCIAELGSGAGLNLRYFPKLKPAKLLAFDCSSQLLALAKKNLSDLSNVEFIHTSGNDLPVPAGTGIDLLYTVTVLQHITGREMFADVVHSTKRSGARHILIVEDVRTPARQPTPDYTLRTPQDYIAAFDDSGYTLTASGYASLIWATRLFGVINRLFGLYRRQEGSQLPGPVFALARLLSPLVRVLDRALPGKFGMTAVLFTREHEKA